MAKGPLRIALDDWFTTNPLGAWVMKAASDYRARLSEVVTTFEKIPPTRLSLVVVAIIPIAIGTFIFVFTGFRWPFDPVVKQIIGVTAPNISGLIAEAIKAAEADPALREYAETMGALISDPVVSLFEQYAGDETKDPKEFARALFGLQNVINAVGGVANLAVQGATGGQVKAVDEFFKGIYWAMGLGFLSWQGLAPLLESGLQTRLNRYYRKLYRPNRFSASELRDLYALGRISRDFMISEAQTLGWRDEDINHWLALSFRHLSEGDVWALYKTGDLTVNEVTARLMALGYDVTDLPLLFKANAKDETKTAAELTRATARTAYHDGLINRDQLRTALLALNLSTTETDLIIAIEDRKIAEADQRLSVGQVKAAWQENVLSDTEAKFWLSKSQIPPDQQAILIATWRAELEPAFRKLNRGTIIGAYVAGILNREQAQSKLVSVGYLQPDAALELDLAEQQNPQAFGRPAAKPARLLTPGNLTDLVVAGLLTPIDMQARLVTAGFAENDAQLLSELARLQAAGVQHALSQSTIERAYLSHVLTRDLAAQRLRDLGLDDAAATIILDTVERQHPADFGAGAPAQPRTLPLTLLAQAVLSGLMNQSEYQTRAQQLGYLADDAALLLAIARQEQATRPRQVSQSTIERAYILQVIDRPTAVAKLKEIGFNDADSETILQSVERDNPAVFAPGTVQAVRQPGPSALVEAERSGIITEQEYFARMLEIGYNQSAAEIYLSLATVAERKSIKRLSDSKILDLYKSQIFTRGETLARLEQNGYNEVDSGLLMRLERSGIEDTQTWADFLAGTITVGDMYQQLLNQGFTQPEIDAALNKIAAG